MCLLFYVYEYRNHLCVCGGHFLAFGNWGMAVAFLYIFIFHLKSRVFKIHAFSYFYIRVQSFTSELEFEHFNLAGTGEGGAE